MFLAMCADAGMLIGILFFLLLAVVVCCTPVVLAAMALERWVGARRKRLAAEPSPAADAV
jgi:hypothetical protein